jgi:LysR family hydrogen peroxide-inducible transcriptional activator
MSNTCRFWRAPWTRDLLRRVQSLGGSPTRRIVLAWRRSFTRYEAIAALRNAVYACELPGVTRLS